MKNQIHFLWDRYIYPTHRQSNQIGKMLLLGLLLLSFNLISTDAKATHATGGEITYTNIGPNQYKIHLKVYRDCNGITMNNSQNIQINRCGINQNLTVTRISITDVTTLCASQQSRCASPAGQIGVEEHLYEGIVTFPPGCNNITLGYELCCRANAITTLNNPGNQPLAISTTLDNTLTPQNNSPSFLNLPTALFAFGQPANLSLGANDPDGDSLAYTLVNAKQGITPIQLVNYAAPFSGVNPMPSSTPISINVMTGQLSFTPNQVSQSVVAVLVEEYRNGVLIGTITRDVNITVRNFGTNNAPTITGVPNQTAYVGQQLCIPIVTNDADGDLISLAVNSGITSGASFVINSSVAGATYGTFCYTPTIADSFKTFTISVASVDDFCPVPSVAASLFNINVLIQCNLSSSTSAVASTCGNPNGSATANPIGGNPPFTYAWTGPGTFSANTQTISGLVPGTYNVTITDGYNCTTTNSVDIAYAGSIITLSGITTGSTCGLNNGSINLSASDGIAPYSYSLNGGAAQSSSSFNNLAPGTYGVTVTDVTTCPTTDSFTVTEIIDVDPPVANCQNFVLNLVNGTGTLTPQDVDNNSTDNCGIANMTVTPNTFTCTDAGINTVTLTVYDAQGNSDNCTADVLVQYQPTCTIGVTPSNNVYTGGVPTTIYLGYGPQSAILNGLATGGANFTYSWSPAVDLDNASIQNPTFTPSADGSYTFTLTATNDNGCSTTCDVTFCVVDVQVPGKNGKSSNKVFLCHVPPGNPTNAHLLSVSVNAVASHLSGHSGDKLGICGQDCNPAPQRQSTTNGLSATEIPDAGFTYKVYPNPTFEAFNLYAASINDEQANLLVFDVTGRIVLRMDNIEMFTTIPFGENFVPGVYIIRVSQGDQEVNTQILKSE